MSKKLQIVAPATCHPEAFQLLLASLLSPVRPPFAVSYRHMVRVASEESWLPIPSERSLRRHIALFVQQTSDLRRFRVRGKQVGSGR